MILFFSGIDERLIWDNIIRDYCRYINLIKTNRHGWCRSESILLLCASFICAYLKFHLCLLFLTTLHTLYDTLTCFLLHRPFCCIFNILPKLFIFFSSCNAKYEFGLIFCLNMSNEHLFSMDKMCTNFIAIAVETYIW